MLINSSIWPSGHIFFWIFQSGLLLEKSILFIFFFFAYYCLGVKLSKKTSGAKISVQKKITRSGPLWFALPLKHHAILTPFSYMLQLDTENYLHVDRVYKIKLIESK